jgi:hypothetical protein
MACGVLGLFGGGVYLCFDTIQGHRTGQFNTLMFGIVERSRQPELFWYAAVRRWSIITSAFGGGLLLLAVRYLISN